MYHAVYRNEQGDGRRRAARFVPIKECADERQQPQQRPVRRVAVMVDVTVINEIEPEHVDIRQKTACRAVERPGTRGNARRFQGVEQLCADIAGGSVGGNHSGKGIHRGAHYSRYNAPLSIRGDSHDTAGKRVLSHLVCAIGANHYLYGGFCFALDGQFQANGAEFYFDAIAASVFPPRRLPATRQALCRPCPARAAAFVFWRGDLAVGLSIVGHSHLFSFRFPANRNHHAQLRRLAPRSTKSRARREKIPLIFRTARL